MQAKLPDINAAIVRHRSNWLKAFDNHEHNAVIVSLSAVNSLLPEDYKVEVNTDKYNKLIEANKLIKCKHCKKDSQFNLIQIIDLLLPPMRSFLTSKESEKVWYCPKCEGENVFDHNAIRIQKFQEPYYLGVIPSPPTKRRGIIDRSAFQTQFKTWYSIASDEIESKIGKYRADYIAQMEGDDIQIPEEKHDEE